MCEFKGLAWLGMVTYPAPSEDFTAWPLGRSVIGIGLVGDSVRPVGVAPCETVKVGVSRDVNAVRVSRAIAARFDHGHGRIRVFCDISSLNTKTTRRGLTTYQ
jgi:hypothetical protein